MDNKQLTFLPLDLPLFEHSEEIYKNFKPIRTHNYWDVEPMTVGDQSLPIGMGRHLTDSHPKLIEYIQKYLPFDNVYTDVYNLEIFRVLPGCPEVGEHADNSYLVGDPKCPNANDNMYITSEFREHQLDTEPCGYRIMLYGDKNTLYYRMDGEIVFTDLPSTTNTYLLKTYNARHGVKLSDIDHGDFLRTVVFVLGKVNKKKHYELIKRSAIKYKDYTI
jgi:hypothetical protein